MTDPVVSISVTAYQHAAYLAKCLDSILAQRCTIPFEVLLGEDASTDGTREIATRYAADHPGTIRLFLRDRSQVVMIDGRPTGRGNFLNNILHARGRYLCHVDGDDHWTDPDRLQVMVDRMEREPDLGLCFHNAWNIYPNGKRIDYVRAWARDRPLRDRYAVDDLIEENFIPTSGVIWRFTPMQEFPAIWWTTPAIDWVMNIWYAGRGPIGYIDRIMSIRSVHAGGIISGMDPVRKAELNLRMLGTIDEVTGGRHARRVEQRRVELRIQALQYCVDQGRWQEARDLWNELKASPEYRAGPRERSRWAVLTRFPALARAFHRLRS